VDNRIENECYLPIGPQFQADFRLPVSKGYILAFQRLISLWMGALFEASACQIFRQSRLRLSRAKFAGFKVYPWCGC